MKIGNYYLMLLLLKKCQLIDEWNFPRVQFMTGNISFESRFRKKPQDQAMQVRGMTYACQAPDLMSPWTYDAPGIMFSIPCKVLGSAKRNSILEWPLDENTPEVMDLSFSCNSLSCLLFLWHHDFYNQFSISVSRRQCRRFLFPPGSLSTR